MPIMMCKCSQASVMHPSLLVTKSNVVAKSNGQPFAMVTKICVLSVSVSSNYPSSKRAKSVSGRYPASFICIAKFFKVA